MLKKKVLQCFRHDTKGTPIIGKKKNSSMTVQLVTIGYHNTATAIIYTMCIQNMYTLLEWK